MRLFKVLSFLAVGAVFELAEANFNHGRRYANSSTVGYLNNATASFAVNGSAIPNVTFDVGESYAGLLPITSDPKDKNQLYFWFFPSRDPSADEIIIWLNGGPGCSSLLGFLDENGPFLWQPGTYRPVSNPWSWVNLTSVVWIDQPVGTGFSPGTPTVKSQTDVATQFLGFWKNFSDLFGLQGRKIYIAGESYAGRYVPYIADAMFSSNDTINYNVKGTMINDALISTNTVQEVIPAVAYTDYWNQLFRLNDTFMDYLHDTADSCGFTEYMNEHLVYPPTVTTSSPPAGANSSACTGLALDIQAAITLKNPCFDLFEITNVCPLLWNPIPPPAYPGYPVYKSQGQGKTFFNMDAVKKAINAPVHTKWEECTSREVFVGGIDTSSPPDLSVYPRVIERSSRSVIAHGALDMILIANGTQMVIQKMKWGGSHGFSKQPSDPFVVPYHETSSPLTAAGAGIYGTTHTERGLTWVNVDLAGHMIPQYAPAAAYRYTQFLLGRIDSLSSA